MATNRRLLAPSLASLALLAAPLGCGTGAPPSTASAPAVETPAGSDLTVPGRADSPQPVASSTPEAPEAPAPFVSDLRQETREVRRQAGAIEDRVDRAGSRVARAAGEGRGRVDRAVTETGGRLEGLPGEINDHASKAVERASGRVSDVVDQVKGEVKGIAEEATGGVRDVVDQARGGVKQAVGGAKDEVRRRARAIEQGVEKSGKDLKKQVVNELLGPAND